MRGAPSAVDAVADTGIGTETDTENVDIVEVDESWWSWSGAHGGYVAALTLAAMRDPDPRRAHPIRALTAHFLAPAAAGPLHLSVVRPSVRRRASTCAVTGRQDGGAVLIGSAVFGAGRPGTSYDGRPPTAVAGPEDCDPLHLSGVAPFARNFEIRATGDTRPLAGGDRAELVAWVRFADGRPLDAEAVVILTDVLPPALYARWRAPRPVPTAELTVHFTDVLDTGPVEGWALVRIRTDQAGGGWAIDESEVRTADGRLLAVARQSRVIQDAARDAPAPA
ncbi:thioesterase family protein [Streptomyces sp. NBC_00878]|uniref:thioesterase family protein n=1 Tax=Streptomyces sp. NBC_00878 TaxID=2975854 RepID=UPI0022560337|nr:thioesterase family protein [Streptomyces sp. NBC_00878]MCX4911086.1 thioesterase family protein [Streptomyces sp. NBC_00878]